MFSFGHCSPEFFSDRAKPCGFLLLLLPVAHVSLGACGAGNFPSSLTRPSTGISSILFQETNNVTAILIYFVVTGVAMLVMLIHTARRFAREA